MERWASVVLVALAGQQVRQVRQVALAAEEVAMAVQQVAPQTVLSQG